MTNEELVELYQNGNREALDKLIDNNIGIVNKIVNKFYIDKINSIDSEDLKQEGMIGLYLAAEKYDINNPNKAKFITYAVFWVHQRISRFLRNNKTNSESSLNAPIGEENKIEFLDMVSDPEDKYENSEERAFAKLLRKELEKAMIDTNSLREREVLKFRYGWDTRLLTLEEVGEILDITGARVRTIEKAALRKLRRSKWVIKNANAFAELGYIDKYYLELMREWGWIHR